MDLSNGPLARGLRRIAWALIFVVGSGMAASYLTSDEGGKYPFGDGVPALAVMLAVVGLITFFGFLSLPTHGNQVSGLSDSGMRFALTGALVMTYIVYFSAAVWRSTTDRTALSTELLSTLTNMLMVVLPFYFGVTGAVEIAKVRAAATKSSQAPEE